MYILCVTVWEYIGGKFLPSVAYGLQRVAPGKGTVASAPGREECRRWSQAPRMSLGVTEASEE